MASYNSITSSINSTNDTGVLVVGAGISGLTAAHELLRRDKGLNILVLEAKERVGGRTYSVPLKTGDDRTEMFDLGGQWVSSLQSHLMCLLNELKIEVYPQYNHGAKAGRAGISVWNTFTYFPIFGPWYCRYELYRFIQQIEKLAEEVPLSDPMKCCDAEELDFITMESFIRQNLYTVTARDIMRTIIRMQFGAESVEISVLGFLTHCRAASGFINQFSSSAKGVREFRIKGGAQQIAQRLMEKIGKHLVILGDPVVEVRQDEDFVYVSTSSKNLYRAEHLILAIPPSEILQIHFEPALSTLRRKLLQKFPAGHVTQFVITYNKPYWREKGFSGDIVDYGGTTREPGCRSGPLTMLCDVTTEEGGPALMGQTASIGGLEWSERKVISRKKAIFETISGLWGPWVNEPLDYAEINWSKEDYIGGCPGHFPYPGMMSWYSILRKPHLRIHWAGTETATQWTGFMNGAVMSGHRAAIEVMYDLRPQALISADLEDIEKGLRDKRKYMRTKYPFTYQWMFGIPITLIILSCLTCYFIRRGIAKTSTQS